MAAEGAHACITQGGGFRQQLVSHQGPAAHNRYTQPWSHYTVPIAAAGALGVLGMGGEDASHNVGRNLRTQSCICSPSQCCVVTTLTRT